jgi:hypothetical protein
MGQLLADDTDDDEVKQREEQSAKSLGNSFHARG